MQLQPKPNTKKPSTMMNRFGIRFLYLQPLTLPLSTTGQARHCRILLSFSRQDFWLSKIGLAMVKDSLSSPHRRSQNSLSSPSYKKHFQTRDEFGNWSTLFQRHRFLLTALALLAFLCTVYLYFAVTMGAAGMCSGLTGKEKALCHLEHAKSAANRKLKFF
ncbi:hypothetical protein RJ641_020295 [Dillenia turbinata]|uniref:Uncharacterized protein n=1 Tax=Dillenia turbinata TaxID=194707 RepID=A0AAN8USH4_9MAGN